MSLVVPSLSGGNLTTSAGTSSAATGAASALGGAVVANGTTTAMPFAQTLVQSMTGGTAKETETPLLGNLASLLQGLLNSVSSTGEEAGQSRGGKDAESSESSKQLEGLLQDIEKLDDNISADPTLLAALQGWLIQVSALLSGSNNPAETGAANMDIDPASGLSPLAQNSDTVRFVVQDDLTSLVNLIQQSSVTGNEKNAAEGIELLNEFTVIMAQVAVPENKLKSKPVVHAETSAVENNVIAKELTRAETTIPDNKAKTVEATNLSNTPAVTLKQQAMTENNRPVYHFEAKAPVQTVGNAAATTAANVESADPLTPVTNTGAASAEVITTPASKTGAEVKPAGIIEEALPEINGTADENNVVTAGQLSLRGGITAPLKATTVQVPVHQFAQEMDKMITGKLEILKKGGVAEATITLFPENLGQVDVKITMQNGNLIAQFLTEHSGAKDMLEQQMSQLRSALQSQGLQVEKLEVSQNSALLSQFNGQQGRQSASGGQQQDGRSKERREEIADAVLAAELNGEWKDWVANGQEDIRNEGGGFSAKA
ncbi:flagellar hook-length control protein FliK [Paenibacillus sp. FSL L8-0436]|uniref:flagellar hook-length control protein FliK n=1 Tax=Paenibacillus sp. FSL L8-0436 TaxID=2954686 RepID=UPI0031591642